MATNLYYSRSATVKRKCIVISIAVGAVQGTRRHAATSMLLLHRRCAWPAASACAAWRVVAGAASEFRCTSPLRPQCSADRTATTTWSRLMESSRHIWKSCMYMYHIYIYIYISACGKHIAVAEAQQRAASTAASPRRHASDLRPPQPILWRPLNANRVEA